MDIHERMQQRILTREDYVRYLRDYRRRERGEWVVLEGESHNYPFNYYGNSMFSHAFDVRDHLRSLKHDPEWVHYMPTSDAYWGYYHERLGDLGGDYYEAKMEDLAERYKAIYWG